MDFLDLAQHRFHELSSTLLRPMTTEASDAWEIWLREDVGAIAAELCQSLRFQHHCTWSLMCLCPGSTQPERLLVEAVDQSLVAAARALLEAVPRTTTGSSAGPLDADLHSVLEWIAGRPWTDLACPGDFFTACRSLNLATTRTDCHREFLASYEPRVPVGDFVCRALMMRVDYFAQKIAAAWQRCMAPPKSIDFTVADSIFSTKIALDQAVRDLQRACQQNNESRLRDACLTLVQVHAAYTAEPKLDWLGFPQSWPQVEGQIIRSTIVRPPTDTRTVLGSQPISDFTPGNVRLCHPRIIHGVASALAAVAGLYRRPIENEDLIDALRQEKRLVMVDSRPRSVYWDGAVIDYDWNSNTVIWDFLWRTAERAKANMPVCEDDLLPPNLRGTRTLVHRRSRLSKAILPSLDSLIEAVRPRGYRLDLPAEQIALLHLDHDEQLVDAGLEVTNLLR